MGRSESWAMVALQDIAVDRVTLESVQTLCVQPSTVLGIETVLAPVMFKVRGVMQC